MALTYYRDGYCCCSDSGSGEPITSPCLPEGYSLPRTLYCYMRSRTGTDPDFDPAPDLETGIALQWITSHMWDYITANNPLTLVWASTSNGIHYWTHRHAVLYMVGLIFYRQELSVTLSLCPAANVLCGLTKAFNCDEANTLGWPFCFRLSYAISEAEPIDSTAVNSGYEIWNDDYDPWCNSYTVSPCSPIYDAAYPPSLDPLHLVFDPEDCNWSGYTGHWLSAYAIPVVTDGTVEPGGI